MKRKILFLTGTRADFGKLLPLMRAVDGSDEWECWIFVTGMHMSDRYGYTVQEVQKQGFRNIHTFVNHLPGEPMELVLSNTIGGVSRYIHESHFDLVVVHGDRVEALAGAITGAMRNVRVAHVEGGEVSGTVDELIRHAVTKMSHIHFVSNDDARTRLLQLGENPESIFVIGSPDIDVMLSSELPALDSVKRHYEIDFEDFALAVLHPVTTRLEYQRERAERFVDALLRSERNFVVIYPNNDAGTDDIHAAYRRLRGNPRIRMFPSVRFEAFLVLLRHSRFIIGNSSAGIREAPVYGIPTIDVGDRQEGRFLTESIVNVDFDVDAMIDAMDRCADTRLEPSPYFGVGESAKLFVEALRSEALWQIDCQKRFRDLGIE